MTTALTEAELHLAIEQLRSEHNNTIDLYKAVAALLFFHYHTTPTTNRMYQLVRKGSMSAPSEALKLFWKELRERSQVRMEQADIPASLTQSAGMLMAQLWDEALAVAMESVESTQQAIYAKLALAEQAQLAAKDEANTLQGALLTAQQQLHQQDEKIATLEAEQQKQQLQAVAQTQTIQHLEEQKMQLQQQHDAALQTQKEQMLLSEQRAADMEKYARLEVDRVRQEAAKDEKQAESQLEKQEQRYQQLQTQWQQLQDEHLVLQQQHHYTLERHEELLKKQKKQELQRQAQQKRPSRLARLRGELLR